jgi:hypothetical protein
VLGVCSNPLQGYIPVKCRFVEDKRVDRDSTRYSRHNSRESSGDLLTLRGNGEFPDALLLTLKSRT